MILAELSSACYFVLEDVSRGIIRKEREMCSAVNTFPNGRSGESLTLADLRRSDVPTITISEVAQAMRCDPRTVSTGIKEGNIPSIRLGRRVLIPREKFLALFDAA